ncbi:cytochrome c1 [Salinispirillum sp. LH 10-3-1]|uniref:Cytochrome c1 n=1 Tax=Salinispirillum sp. LH 10-3-1 TaxID=2952525 RepID=A0AB38YDG8_9GAMM
MKKVVFTLLVALLPVLASAAKGPEWLDRINTDQADTRSLQRGAQVYFNNCMGCHGLEYARYNRVAKDLEIPEDIFQEYLMSTDQRIGDLMTIAMSRQDGTRFFGVAPPDLTLIARVRGTDWLYTYLRGFYADETRPYGVNNVVYPDVGMPHAMVDAQGLCAEPPKPVAGVRIDPLTGDRISEGGCERYLTEGQLSKVEFDQSMFDLVNFLEYMGEPIKLERQRLGWFVMAFLTVFLAFSWLLYRELWKDVK